MARERNYYNQGSNAVIWDSRPRREPDPDRWTYEKEISEEEPISICNSKENSYYWASETDHKQMTTFQERHQDECAEVVASIRICDCWPQRHIKQGENHGKELLQTRSPNNIFEVASRGMHLRVDKAKQSINAKHEKLSSWRRWTVKAYEIERCPLEKDTNQHSWRQIL